MKWFGLMLLLSALATGSGARATVPLFAYYCAGDFSQTCTLDFAFGKLQSPGNYVLNVDSSFHLTDGDSIEYEYDYTYVFYHDDGSFDFADDAVQGVLVDLTAPNLPGPTKYSDKFYFPGLPNNYNTYFPDGHLQSINYFNYTRSPNLSFALNGNPSFVGFLDLTLSAAPEPDEWALLIFGFAGIGAALRKVRSCRLSSVC